ncbi:hypothetical protein HN873_061166 [Arachis hypogaea]
MTLTKNCHVYSFRVVALETLRGRHPRELISSSLDDSSNKNIMVKDLLDPRIRLPLIKTINAASAHEFSTSKQSLSLPFAKITFHQLIA